MKKIMSLLLAAVMLLSLAACGGSKKSEPAAVGSVDGEALFQVLLQNVTYDSLLTDQGKAAAMSFSGLPEGATVKVYRGMDSYADCLGLVTLKAASDQEAARNSVAAYLKQLHTDAVNYNKPAQKFEDAAIWQNGIYLIFCVTDDIAEAQNIMDNAAEMTQGVAVEKETTPEETKPSENEVQNDTTQPTQPSVPEVVEYPELISKSGTYSYYDGTGVYKVDDMAFENYAYDEYAAANYAQVINDFADEMAGEAKVYVLAIPTAIGIVFPDDVIPKFKDYENQNDRMQLIFSKMNSNVNTINCYDNLMRHRDEYLYFHTDFHWNGKAAYYAYETWCKAVGETPYTLDQRQLKTFDGFYGALYLNSCGHDPDLAEDTVEAYLPYSKNVSMKFTDVKGNEYAWNVVMDVSDWSSGTKYNAFGGGDNPITVYQNPDVTDGSVGIVVKESFGNALMPYMVDHYSTLYEIDYRYWSGNLADFAREVGATEITFANNMGMMRTSMLVGMLAGIMD